MSVKRRLSTVEGFNSFVIPFEKSTLKNACNRKRPFDIKDTDLSSIEFKKHSTVNFQRYLSRGCKTFVRQWKYHKRIWYNILCQKWKKAKWSFRCNIRYEKFLAILFEGKAFKVCSHVLSVASVLKLLKPFVHSCNKRQKKITPLVDFNKD